MPLNNADAAVVEGFGDEWVRFDQSNLPDSERLKIFNQYFSIFPWDRLPADAHGFDAGCGSGRWAREVAGRVGHLNLIDASQAALDVAKRNLEGRSNAKFYCASVAEMPIEDASQDFGYSLGVLHHIPDTKAGLISCVKKLKAGAPFLVYLYYRFDNRPIWFQAIWRVSDGIRRVISVLPNSARYLISQIIAATVYWPLSRLAWLIERLGGNPQNLPLAGYRDKSYYTLRTDALDRFGTRLEQRFTQDEIRSMMLDAGLVDIVFNEQEPFWCAVGIKQN